MPHGFLGLLGIELPNLILKSLLMDHRTCELIDIQYDPEEANFLLNRV